MNHKLKLDRVSELEWYLTMQSYHDITSAKKKVQKQRVPPENVMRNMTLDEFHEFYESLKAPILWNETGILGFLGPFDDEVIIPSGEYLEVPLGFSIEGDFEVIQPSEKLHYSMQKIKGNCNGNGMIVKVENVSKEDVPFRIMMNWPFCSLNIRLKEESNNLFHKHLTDMPENKVVFPVFIEEDDELIQKSISFDLDVLSSILQNQRNNN